MFSLERLKRLRHTQLAANVAWSLYGLGTKVVLQAAYFIIVARSLDPGGYGVFVALTAALNILAPFLACGTGALMIRATARRQTDYRPYLGMAITTILSTGALALLLAPVALVICQGSTKHLLVIEALVLTELLLLPLQQLSAQAFQAHAQMKHSARILAGASGYRLVAAVGFMLLPIQRTLDTWAMLYASATLLSTLTALYLLNRNLGLAPLGLGPLKAEFGDGFHFALGVGTQTAYIEADKIMLAQIGGASAAGIYAAAYRLLDASFTPVRAILHSTYSSFFKSGAAGIAEGLRLARRLIPGSLAAGVGCSLVACMISFFVPALLGSKYLDAANALLLLAPVLTLRAVYFFLGDAFSSSGFQSVRNGLQILVAFQSTALNYFLIAAWGWRGAVATCLIADISLVIYYCIAAIFISRRAATK